MRQLNCFKFILCTLLLVVTFIFSPLTNALDIVEGARAARGQITTAYFNTLKAGTLALIETPNSGFNIYPGGSADFSLCQKHANKKWDLLVGKDPDPTTWRRSWLYLANIQLGRKGQETTFTSITNNSLAPIEEAYMEALKEYLDASANEKEKKLETLNAQTYRLKNKYETMLNEADLIKQKFEVCEAMLGMMAYVDYDKYNDDDGEDVEREKIKSADRKITCRTHGSETQDFPQCKKTRDYYNALLVGKVGLTQYQRISFSGAAQDAYIEASKNPMDPTNGFKGMETTTRKQADLANQRAVFEGAKLATLAGMLKLFPHRNKLKAECKNRLNRNSNGPFSNVNADYRNYRTFIKDRALAASHNHITINLESASNIKTSTTNSSLVVTVQEGDYFDSIGAAVEGNSTALYPRLINKGNLKFELDHPVLPNSNPETVCHSVAMDGTNALIENTLAYDQIKQILFEAGIEMSKEIANGIILNKQADRINDAIQEIEEFTPINLNPFGTEQIAYLAKCTAQPSLPECQASLPPNSVDFDRSGGPGFTFSGAGAATTGPLAGDIGGAYDNAVGSGNTGRKNPARSIGSIDNNISGKKGSGLDPTRGSGATLKEGGTIAGPGGGASTGGGGGGGGANNKAAGGKKSYAGAYNPSGVGYGKGGRLSFGGSRRGKRGSRNPLAGLLGGKKKKGKGGTMMFRNLAGANKQISNKNGDIFKMITNRYKAVNKSKRLLVYKIKKDSKK